MNVINSVLALLAILLVGVWYARHRQTRRPRLLTGPERAALKREVEQTPEVMAGVQQARTRWPEFLAAWRERRDEVLGFAVKGPVSDGDKSEVCWLNVTAIEGDVVAGTISVQPCDLNGIAIGSQASFPISELRDWMYVEQDETPRGAFTARAVRQAREVRGM